MKKIITSAIITVLAVINLAGCTQPAPKEQTQDSTLDSTYTVKGTYYSTSFMGGKFLFFNPEQDSVISEKVGKTVNISNSEAALKMLNINVDELGCTDYEGTATLELKNLKFVKSEAPSEPDTWLAEVTKVAESVQPTCEI